MGHPRCAHRVLARTAELPQLEGRTTLIDGQRRARDVYPSRRRGGAGTGTVTGLWRQGVRRSASRRWNASRGRTMD
jgi:hypothetical protein